MERRYGLGRHGNQISTKLDDSGPMEPWFDIDIDVPRDLVRIRMGGFFTLEAMERFRIARDLAHLKLRCAPNAHLTLTDISQMAIQSQDMVIAFQRLLSDPVARSRKLAFIHGTTLARMQVQRAAANRYMRTFATAAEAEAWLFAPDEDELPQPVAATG